MSFPMPSSLFTAHLPPGPDAARQAVYDGAVFHCPASQASQGLAQAVYAEVQAALGPDPVHVHARAGFAAIYPALTQLRAGIAASPAYRQAMKDVMRAAGFDPDGYVLDDLRLRCVMHEGHLNDGAAKAYALHRDTWYGNPQSQINFWIPLHDVDERMTFTFYPGYFSRAIDNTSHGFDFLAWIEKTGWQGAKNAPDHDYPRASARPDGAGATFAAQAGDVVVFSAAHLHETTPNASGLTRFSLDFRAVHAGDHARGLGAPNADNGSRPDALRAYK